RRTLADEERGDLLAFSAPAVFLARSHEDDGEIGNVGVANEMLGAVEHPVATVVHGARLHAAQVGAGARRGHGEAVGFFAAEAGEQILLALLRRPGEQDVGRARHAGPVQRIVGAAELLLVEEPCRRIEPRPADIGRHVGGVEARFDRLRFQLVHEFGPQHAGALDLLFVRIEFVLDEGAGGLDDELLFFREAEIHLINPSCGWPSWARLSWTRPSRPSWLPPSSPASRPSSWLPASRPSPSWPAWQPWPSTRASPSSPRARKAASYSRCRVRRRPSPCPCSACRALP